MAQVVCVSGQGPPRGADQSGSWSLYQRAPTTKRVENPDEIDFFSSFSNFPKHMNMILINNIKLLAQNCFGKISIMSQNQKRPAQAPDDSEVC